MSAKVSAVTQWLPRVLGARRSSLLATGCYALCSLALFAALGMSDGWRAAVLSGGTLLLGATVPGTALVRLLLPNRGSLHYLVLGTTFGLMLWTLGGFLSHLTGSYVVRWVPSILAVLLFTMRLLGRVRLRHSSHPLPPLVALGGVAGMIALIPALRTALLTQPASWDGWFSLYGDLPFQAAITAEVASRAPEQAPWVAGTPLSYTWAFHSAMGVWSSTSTVSPSEVVFQVWPVLFTVLIPGLIAIVAWELSRNAWVSGLAPIVFTLAHGVLMSPASFVQMPLFAVSPTRDFGHLATLVVVLGLSKTLRRRSIRALSIPWLVALGLAVLVATAAKGSLLPVLLGGIAAGCFILLISRRFAWSDLLASVAFAIGAIAGFATAIPDSNSARSLGWGPLTFLGPANQEVLLSLLMIALILAAIVGFWLVLGRSVNWTISSVLAGAMLAGVLGLSLLSQSGGSQNYFWQAVEPLVAISIAWCGVILQKTYGTRVILVVACIAALANVAVHLTSNPSFLFAGVIALAGVGTGAIIVGRSERATPRGAVGPIAIALLLTQAAQLVGVSQGFVGGSVTSAEDVSGTHSSQLAAFEFIRKHSTTDEVIATNAHCLHGTLAAGDCLPQRFILAAMTERRVLVEGWSYTQFGDSMDWVKDKINLGDDFIDAPSLEGARKLEKTGVSFVYVDLRLHPSSKLGDYATLVFESQWARVYELHH